MDWSKLGNAGTKLLTEEGIGLHPMVNDFVMRNMDDRDKIVTMQEMDPLMRLSYGNKKRAKALQDWYDTNYSSYGIAQNTSDFLNGDYFNTITELNKLKDYDTRQDWLSDNPFTLGGFSSKGDWKTRNNMFMADVLKGASTAAEMSKGNPWAILGGTIAGGLSAWINQHKAKKAGEEANRLKEEYLTMNKNIANQQLDTLNRNIFEANQLNQGYISAKGGPLMTNGATFNTGVTSFNNGGSHEDNPNGGVQQGIAPDGQPNLVEEGEVKWNDYIFSKRLSPSEELLHKYYLHSKYFGKNFAEIAKCLNKEVEETPNDSIALRTRDAMLERLKNAQEEVRMKDELENQMNQVAQMSSEELAQMQYQQNQQAMAQQQMAQQNYGVPAEEMMQQAPADEMNMQEMPMQGLEIMSAYGGPIFAQGGHLFAKGRSLIPPKFASDTSSTYFNGKDTAWTSRKGGFNTPIGIVVHHTGTTTPIELYDNKDTGAHFLIFYNGKKKVYAPDNSNANHAQGILNQDLTNFPYAASVNNRFLGVEFQGRDSQDGKGENQLLTNAQLEAFVEIMGPKIQEYKIPFELITSHYEVNQRNKRSKNSYASQWNSKMDVNPEAMTQLRDYIYKTVYAPILQQDPTYFDATKQQFQKETGKSVEQFAAENKQYEADYNLSGYQKAVEPSYNKKNNKPEIAENNRKPVPNTPPKAPEGVTLPKNFNPELIQDGIGFNPMLESQGFQSFGKPINGSPMLEGIPTSQLNKAQLDEAFILGEIDANDYTQLNGTAPTSDLLAERYEETALAQANIPENLTGIVQEFLDNKQRQGVREKYLAGEIDESDPSLAEVGYTPSMRDKNQHKKVVKLMNKTVTTPEEEQAVEKLIDVATEQTIADDNYKNEPSEDNKKKAEEAAAKVEQQTNATNETIKAAQNAEPEISTEPMTGLPTVDNSKANIPTPAANTSETPEVTETPETSNDDTLDLADIKEGTPETPSTKKQAKQGKRYYYYDVDELGYKTPKLIEDYETWKNTGDNAQRYKYAKTKTTQEDDGEYEDVYFDLVSETDLLPTWQRYAPVFGSMIGLERALQPADYSNIKPIIDAKNNAISFQPLGNYMPYKSFDRMFYENQQNMADALLRQDVLNNANNYGSAMAGLLAVNAQHSNNLGKLARVAEEENYKMMLEAKKHNADIDRINSTGMLDAARANQDNFRAAALAEAEMRHGIDSARAQAIGQNLSNFFNNIGGIGTENWGMNFIRRNPSNVGYAFTQSGDVTHEGKKHGGYFKTIKPRKR